MFPNLSVKPKLFPPPSARNQGKDLTKILDNYSEKALPSQTTAVSNLSKTLVKCPDCSYECSSDKMLRQHRLKCHNEGNAIICICGFIFLTPEHYKSHINLVTNVKHQKSFNRLIKNKKKELDLKNYRFIHTEHLRAPKPENANFVRDDPERNPDNIFNFYLFCRLRLSLVIT